MEKRITIAGIFLFLCLLVDGATISTNKTTYAPGETITVTFGAANAKTDWVGMYNSTITPGPQNSVAWLYLNGSQITTGAID